MGAFPLLNLGIPPTNSVFSLLGPEFVCQVTRKFFSLCSLILLLLIYVFSRRCILLAGKHAQFVEVPFLVFESSRHPTTHLVTCGPTQYLSLCQSHQSWGPNITCIDVTNPVRCDFVVQAQVMVGRGHDYNLSSSVFIDVELALHGDFDLARGKIYAGSLGDSPVQWLICRE